jgi:hypothetical protein
MFSWLALKEVVRRMMYCDKYDVFANTQCCQRKVIKCRPVNFKKRNYRCHNSLAGFKAG